MSVQHDEMNDLLDYFRYVVLVTAANLQSWTKDKPEKVEAEGDSKTTCDDFGNALLDCIYGMSSQEVGTFINIGSINIVTLVFCIISIPVLLHRLAHFSSLALTSRCRYYV